MRFIAIIELVSCTPIVVLDFIQADDTRARAYLEEYLKVISGEVISVRLVHVHHAIEVKLPR